MQCRIFEIRGHCFEEEIRAYDRLSHCIRRHSVVVLDRSLTASASRVACDGVGLPTSFGESNGGSWSPNVAGDVSETKDPANQNLPRCSLPGILK